MLTVDSALSSSTVRAQAKGGWRAGRGELADWLELRKFKRKEGVEKSKTATDEVAISSVSQGTALVFELLIAVKRNHLFA